MWGQQTFRVHTFLSSSNFTITAGQGVIEYTIIAGGYTADRWLLQVDGSSATRAVSQQALTPGSITGYESPCPPPKHVTLLKLEFPPGFPT